MIKLIRFFILGAVMMSSAAFAADTYTIDPAHSSFGFAVKHMMVSNVTGRFNEFSGTVAFDPKDLATSSAKVTIQTNSINTGVQKRDDDLKSADFFDASKYPTITFVSKSIAGQGEQYTITGDLTIKGVTKEVTIPVTISGPVKNPMGGTNVGISGEITLKRKDYGITWNKSLDNGGVMVGDDVKIDINVEAKKE